METITTFFEALGLWSWAILGVLCLAHIFTLERPHFWFWRAVFSVLLIALLWKSPTFQGWHGFEHRVALIVGYFACGVFWMCIRWMLYVWKVSDKMHSAIEKYSAKYPRNLLFIDSSIYGMVFRDIPGLDHFSIRSDLENDKTVSLADFTRLGVPKVADNKGHLGVWFLYWPFSIVKYVFSDLFQFVWERVYAACRKFLQSMANKIFVRNYG